MARWLTYMAHLFGFLKIHKRMLIYSNLIYIRAYANREVQPSFFVVTVKYLKDVMPFFRKASILADIGWDFERTGGFLAQANCQNETILCGNGKSDTKQIPLLLCHLTKPILPSSPEANKYAVEDSIGNRVFEIYSPNRQQVCIIRCKDEAQTSAWFSAVHTTVTSLLKSALKDANILLVDVLEGTQLKHMGWLYEKVG